MVNEAETALEKRLRTIARLHYSQRRAVILSEGAQFTLTFAEFWDIWRGYWMTRHKGRKILCQIDITKPYAAGNLHMVDRAQAMRDWHRQRRALGLPRGSNVRRILAERHNP